MLYLTLLALQFLGLVTAQPVSLSSHLHARESSSWPLPHNVTGDSSIYVHDPCVIKHNNEYYSFTTHDLVGIAKAPTLSGPWVHYGSVLNGDSIINIPGRNDTWAPDVISVNGIFYCFYAVSVFGSQISAIGVATSTKLAPGSWRDLGQVITSGPDVNLTPQNITNAIDPAVFIDPKTNKAYLNYGSFYGDLWQFEMNADLVTVVQNSAIQVSIDLMGTRPEEGSFMNYKDGYYYLWFSHGICCGFNASALPAPGLEYSIRVGRSTSVIGPFVDQAGVALDKSGGTIVYGSNNYVYAPGGQGVLSDGGRDILYFHYLNRDIDYVNTLLGWDYIEYVDGWPVLSY